MQADTAARALCRERCARRGEPPCWSLPGPWPNPECEDGEDLGCVEIVQMIKPEGE